MADQKLTALGAAGTIASSDLLYLVVDPGGTPLSKKATIADVVAAAGGGGGSIITALGSLPAAGTDGRIAVFTDSPYIARDNGASWEFFYPFVAGPVGLPSAAGFTWVNQHTSAPATTINTTPGYEEIVVPSSQGSATQIQARVAANPSSSFTAIALITGRVATANFDSEFGLFLYESGSGKGVILSYNGSIPGFSIRVFGSGLSSNATSQNNATGSIPNAMETTPLGISPFSGVLVPAIAATYNGVTFHHITAMFKVTVDTSGGGTYHYYYSVDGGATYTELGSGRTNSDFTTSPDKVGWAIGANRANEYTTARLVAWSAA